MTPAQVSLAVMAAVVAAALGAMVLTPLAVRPPLAARAAATKADRLELTLRAARPAPGPPAAPKDGARLAPELSPPPLPRPADDAPVAAVEAREPDDGMLVPKPREPEPPIRRHWHEQPLVDNICTRTGGRRIETRGGKSWRCQYGRQ